MRTAKDSGGCFQQLGGFRSDELLVEGMWRLEAWEPTRFTRRESRCSTLLAALERDSTGGVRVS